MASMSATINNTEFAAWLEKWMAQVRENGHVIESIPDDSTNATENDARASDVLPKLAKSGRNLPVPCTFSLVSKAEP